MKKTIIQAILFSITIHICIIGYQLIKGYLLTKSYIPSVTYNYENIYVLQNEVAFGVTYNAGGILLLLVSLFVAVSCFIVGKVAFKKVVR